MPACYICKNECPKGQSVYEDHGVVVCLQCFRTSQRCKKCKFPSKQLELTPGFGLICEFCRGGVVQDSGMTCCFCMRSIPTWMSHYSDYGKFVCQDCFKDAKRCFLCRWPKSIENVPGLGGLCEECKTTIVQKSQNLDAQLQPLKLFLAKLNHKITQPPEFTWVDWHLLLGMQTPKPPQVEIQFLDEFLHFGYPAYFIKGKIFIMPRLTQAYFMPYVAGQLATADLCQRWQIPHLGGDTAMLRFARAWCHWVAHYTATTLKYTHVQKFLSRYPEKVIEGDFQKLIAMADFRKPKEIVDYAQNQLNRLANH